MRGKIGRSGSIYFDGTIFTCLFPNIHTSPDTLPLSDTLKGDTSLAMDSQSPEPETSGPVAGSPSDFLKNIVGKKVKVRIGSGVDYHGEWDGFLVWWRIPPLGHSGDLQWEHMVAGSIVDRYQLV